MGERYCCAAGMFCRVRDTSGRVPTCHHGGRVARRSRRHLGRRRRDPVAHREGRGRWSTCCGGSDPDEVEADGRVPHRCAPAGPHRRRLAHRVRGGGASPRGHAVAQVLEVDATLSELAVTAGAGLGGGPAGAARRRCSPGPPRAEARLRAHAPHRRSPPGRAGRRHDRRSRQGGRRAAAAGAARRDAVRRPRPHRRPRAAARARRGLEAVHLAVLNPIQPMLAASAGDVAEALGLTGPASVEWKLDGARIQVHRADAEVRIYTRNLNDVTSRLPGIVTCALGPVGRRRSCSTARSSGWTRTPRPRPSRTRCRRSAGTTRPGAATPC